MGFPPGAAKTTTPAHEHGGVAGAQVDPSVAPNRAGLLPCYLVHHDALRIHFVSPHAEREAVERARDPKTRRGRYGPQPLSIAGNDGVVRRAFTRSTRAPRRQPHPTLETVDDSLPGFRPQVLGESRLVTRSGLSVRARSGKQVGDSPTRPAPSAPRRASRSGRDPDHPSRPAQERRGRPAPRSPCHRSQVGPYQDLPWRQPADTRSRRR